jgi:Transcription factor WhiB
MKVTLIKYSWQKESLCKKELKFVPGTRERVPYVYDDFYPPTGKAVSKEVKDMCKRCPVKNECLEHGLYHEENGYWGGTTEQERKELRVARHITCHAPQSHFNKQQ